MTGGIAPLDILAESIHSVESSKYSLTKSNGIYMRELRWYLNAIGEMLSILLERLLK